MGLAEKDGTLTLKKRSVKKKKNKLGWRGPWGREIGERRGSSQSRREGERRYKPVGCEYIIHTVCRVIGYLIYSRVLYLLMRSGLRWAVVRTWWRAEVLCTRWGRARWVRLVIRVGRTTIRRRLVIVYLTGRNCIWVRVHLARTRN